MQNKCIHLSDVAFSLICGRSVKESHCRPRLELRSSRCSHEFALCTHNSGQTFAHTILVGFDNLD